MRGTNLIIFINRRSVDGRRRGKRRGGEEGEEGGGVGGEGWDWKGEGSTTVEGYRSGRVKYPSDGQFSGQSTEEREKIARARRERERKIGCSTREKERESELFAH